MTKLNLKIDGMHCKSCSALIQDILEENDGIKTAKVSLDAASAAVEYDDTKVSEKEIKKLITDEGYKVK